MLDEKILFIVMIQLHHQIILLRIPINIINGFIYNFFCLSLILLDTMRSNLNFRISFIFFLNNIKFYNIFQYKTILNFDLYIIFKRVIFNEYLTFNIYLTFKINYKYL